MKHDDVPVTKGIFYILGKDGRARTTTNLRKWHENFRNTRLRRVSRTKTKTATVSTVFLGMNHRFGDGPPLVWETMIIGGDLDAYQTRCSGTRTAAIAMHKEVVQKQKRYEWDHS